MSEQFDDQVSLLYSAGSRMCADAMKSDRLPKSKRDFVHAWGRFLMEASHFALSQNTAGILSEEEIIKLVELPLDVASTYREPSPV